MQLAIGRKQWAMVAAASAMMIMTGTGVLAGPRALAATAGTSLAAAPAGTWGTAQQVPGTAALNANGEAEVTSVSCASAGNCTAGGYYADSSGTQAFVATEANGTWGSARELPGSAALNVGDNAEVISVSCRSVGNCTAGGYYATDSAFQAFVATEANGVWRKARELPGIAGLNVGGWAEVTSVSCGSAGNCAAGGYYFTDSAQNRQAFVATEADGVWSKAREVPGTAALDAGGYAGVYSVSCATAGNCAAGGYYSDSAEHARTFVADEVNGAWRKARQVPGTATPNNGEGAAVYSVSCPSAGNCAAGGYYTPSSGTTEAFVASEVNGTWDKARPLYSVHSFTESVSCASAGNCAAGGYYIDSSGNGQAFVVSEKKGSWGTAQEVPGSATLNAGTLAMIASVSCASAGNCAAAGEYTDSTGARQAMVASEANGTWGTAEEIPGTAALTTGGWAAAATVSCPAAANCAAGGWYQNPGYQAFVVNETPSG